MSKSTLSSTKVATIKLGNFDSKGIFPETFWKTFPKSTGKILSRFKTNITLSRESVDIKATWLTRMLTECVMMTDVHPRYVFSKVNFFCGHTKTFNWFSLHSSSCVRALFWKPFFETIGFGQKSYTSWQIQFHLREEWSLRTTRKSRCDIQWTALLNAQMKFTTRHHPWPIVSDTKIYYEALPSIWFI